MCTNTIKSESAIASRQIIIHKYTPGIELHVADVLDAVAGELQLGDEGVEVVRDVVHVVVRNRGDVILTMTEIVTRASGQGLEGKDG